MWDVQRKEVYEEMRIIVGKEVGEREREGVQEEENEEEPDRPPQELHEG